MKNRNDGTHEPGLRRAGAPDAAPEVDQAELDAVIARVAALENTVATHTLQLAGYSAQLVLLSAMMEQRKDTLVRVGIATDIALVDTGPRYMLQAFKPSAQGPGFVTGIPQIKVNDRARSVTRYTDVATNRLQENSPDNAPGYFSDTVSSSDGELQQHDSNDYSVAGIAFLGYFERPGAIKRQYLLKAVTGGVADGPIAAPGVQVGDTVYAVAGNDQGSINRFWNDDETSDDETDPLQPVALHPDNEFFETTVTVNDQIQQISEDDLSANTYLFFLCRGATEEAAAPRDYFLSMMAGGTEGAGACPCPRSFLGDVVEAVIQVDGRSFADVSADFEATISVTGQIQQTTSDDLRNMSHLIFFSRPTEEGPTTGTPAPIAVPGAVASDVVANAFLVDQESGELAELYPVTDYFEETVTVDNQIQQLAGQLDGKAIAFVLKHIFPLP